MTAPHPRRRHNGRAPSGGCPHLGLRLVTFDEEPNPQERARRPFTCEDCNALLGALASRFTQAQVTEVLLKERAHGR